MACMQVLQIFTDVPMHPLIKVKCSYSPFNLDLWEILTIYIYSYFRGKLLIQHGDIKSNPSRVLTLLLLRIVFLLSNMLHFKCRLTA